MRKVIPLLLLILLPFAAPVNLDACGPYFPEAMFVYTLHPDLPLESFAAGQLGILQPTYARSYLYVAYRYLNGTGFNAEEQKELARLWDERMNLAPVDTAENVQIWLDARGGVQGLPEPQPIDSFKTINWQSFPNCARDAFASAAATLQDRIRRFGADNPAVREWVLAQDQVFANCAGESATIPQAAAASIPGILRADRQYQIAAAYFYSGNYADARKRFHEIAGDSSSPWKGIAPYLALRALVREGTIGAGLDQPPNMETLRQAEEQLQRLPADADAQRLLSYVTVRIDPEVRAHELVTSLLKKDGQQTLYQDLWDYTMALDKLSADGPQQDDLTQWLFTFQSENPASFDASLKKWKETSAVPWLVAAISKAPASNPSAAELIAAAGKIGKDSVAFFTVAYHMARLLMESGRTDGARQKLDSLLEASKSAIPATALNRFLALRMKLATNVGEFLKYAQRVPAAVGIDYMGLEVADQDERPLVPPTAVFLDEDGAAVINAHLPLEVMEQAARSGALDEALQKRLMKAVWVRAVLLNRMDVATRMIPDVQPLVPDSEPLWKAITAESEPESAKFAAVFLLLKTPGLEPEVRFGLERGTPIEEIDDYRDNWWCAMEVKPSADAAFLDSSANSAAATEMASLAATGPAPNYLAMQTIQWAGAHMQDPRVPEALHLAVKATRFGCTDEASTRYSKEAFQILHKSFPQSQWARKTPYYY